MANTRISQLPSGSVPTELDIIPIVDYETLTTTGVRASYLAAFVTGSISQLSLNSLTASVVSGSRFLANANGTATAPSYTFANDTTTGFSRGSTVGSVVLSLAGTSRFSFSGQDFNGTNNLAPLMYNDATSASRPGFSFVSDTDSGMYRVAADEVGITTGGANRFGVNGINTIVSGNLLVNTGSLTSPSLSFINDPDTGLYRSTSDQVGLTAGGVDKFFWNLTHFGSTTTNGPILTTAGGSVTAPAFTFLGDLNTGMYPFAADNIGFSTGGTIRLGISDVVAVSGNFTVRNGTAGFAFDPSSQILGTTFGTGGSFIIKAESPTSTTGGILTFGGSTRGDTIKNAITFGVGSTEYMRVDGDFTGHTIGFVGIGNTIPTQRLDVSGNVRVNNALTASVAQISNIFVNGVNTNIDPNIQFQILNNTGNSIGIISSYTTTTAAAGILTLARGRGTAQSPTTPNLNDTIGYLNYASYNAAGQGNTSDGARIHAVTSEAWGVSSHGTNLLFSTKPTGTNTLIERMSLSSTSASVVFNDSGANYDLRIEGVNDQQLLVAKASTNNIGFGTNSPNAAVKVDINGHLNVANVLTASYITGYSSIINYLTGNYMLQSTDAGKTLAFGMPSQSVLIVPTGLPNGFGVSAIQQAQGRIMVSASMGVLLFNRLNQSSSAGQYAVIGLTHLSGNNYIVGGDTT